jgi:UDP-N-acetylmuramoyl-tripeptide--D-alanyl-D-alanine ligase
MITLDLARETTGGEWIRQPYPGGTPLRGAAFDTRALGTAEIFIALRGEHADGHDFLPKLAGSNIKLALVSRPTAAPGFDGALLRVPDTLYALGDLARLAVSLLRPTVVAVTGSYGKTTTKEVLAYVLSAQRRVLASPGSLNNEIGVPVTLLGLDASHDTCVLEFSCRKPGDIAYLAGIAPPHLAVLTAVGHAHVGVFGSLEAVYRTKGEIFGPLHSNGLALVNGDDPRLLELTGSHRTQTFGRMGDFRAEDVTTDSQGRQSFVGVHGTTRLAFRSEIPGAHGFYPILAAWAVAREFGIPDADVVERAGRHPAQKGRAMLLHAPGGATLIDDTYNASPETVRNLVTTLGTLIEPEKILVLGRLAELEEGLDKSSTLIGEVLRPPLTEVWVHAPGQPELHSQLRSHAQGVIVRDIEDLGLLIAALRGRDRPGTAIGFKASRSAHLERSVQGMLGAHVTCRMNPCGLLKHCTDCEAMTRHG